MSDSSEKFVTHDAETHNWEKGEILNAVTSHLSNIIITENDDALKYADKHKGAQLTPEMDRALLRKADIHITSILALCNGIAFADKTLTGSGSILGLIQDIDAEEGGRFGWTSSAFYLSYLIMSPIMVCMVKLPPAKVMAAAFVVWGIIVACTAAADNYPGFVVCRVLLGMLESATVPAQVIITSQWYTKSEHFSRTCAWFSFNGLCSLVATSMSYGLLVRQDKKDLTIHAWRVPFIFFGCLTFLVGILVYFLLPDSPAKAKFLTEEEKAWHVERIRENKQGYGSHKFKWHQILEALYDIRTYIVLIAVVFGNVVNGIISTFMSLIMEGLNYTPEKNLLMQLPQSACEFVGCGIGFLLAGRVCKNKRSVWALVVSAVDVMALCFVPWGNTNMALAGLYLFAFCNPMAYVSFISWIESNTAGYTKKLFVNSVLLVSYCAGNFAGPFAMTAEQRPKYPTGKVLMAASVCINFAMVCLMVIVNYIANKRRDKANKKLPPEIENPEFADLTDFENPEFRYSM